MRSKALLLTATVHLAVIASPAPALADGPDDTPAAAKAESSKVWVHLDARKGVVLFQQRTPESAWEPACTAPCDIRLPNGFHYRAGGSGLSLSPDFTLESPPGTRETVVVARAGKTAFVLGIVLLSAGPVVNLVGWGVVFSAFGGDGPGGSTATVGLAVAGAGSLMVIAGLVLTIMNAGSHAQVSQELEPSAAGLLAPGSWRMATWSTATTEPKSAQPAAGIPILSGRF
jgi:hypothetical protein